MEEKKTNNIDESVTETEETAEGITTISNASEDESASISTEMTEEISEASSVRYEYRWNYEAQSQHDYEEVQTHNRKGLRNYAIVMSIALFAAMALLVGSIFVGNTLPSNTSTTYTGDLDSLYTQCYPSYVAISVVSDNGTSSAGSGIVMTADGYIATNYHVVDDAKSISVILHDGTTVSADFVDGDELNDIAIIKIAKKGLTPAKIGSSSETRVGERVMAIGTPHSVNYRGTMTSGYISATNRQYATQNDNGTIQKVVTLLQTDTSVNPGNSGGPLFNMKGEVIGIVCMKLTGLYEGMGFAIPIDGVIDMLYDIIDNGELTLSNGGSAFEGAAIGITGMTVNKDTTYLLMEESIITTVLDENGEICVKNALGEYIPVSNIEAMEEMGITDFSLYTAPASGVRVIRADPNFDCVWKLRPEDIIITANGISCTQIEILQSLVAAHRVGDKLTLEVWRKGEILSVSVELGRASTME